MLIIHTGIENGILLGDALVLSEQLFTDVIDELERNPDVSFVLDGQLSILDDYVQLHKEK